MIVLRDYQEALVGDIRSSYAAGIRRVLAVAPTGSGKTVIFSHIATGAAQRQKRVWILAHRIELLDQISTSLTGFGSTHGFIAADYPERRDALVQVAGVFTIARRLDRVAPPDLIVVDEAHHATNSTTWGTILGQYPKARVLGVTATPCRLDGSGLDQCFDKMVLGPTVAELTASGALVPLKAYAPSTISVAGVHSRGGDFAKGELERVADNATITGDVVSHYVRFANNRPAVAFCVSVRHAEHVAQQFSAAGISARSVDGSLDRQIRRQIIRQFVAGEIKVLTSCDLVSEGFDVPRLEVGISLRPTYSEGLWLQQVGRLLRPFPGKTHALLFDHAGNLMRHGLPDDERHWTLKGRPRRASSEDQGELNVSVRICAKCFAAVRAGLPACPECGTPFPIKPREVDVQEGELVEVDQDQLRKLRRKEQYGAGSLESLIELGKQRGYKNPVAWAEHVWRGRQGKGAHRLAID